MDPFKKHFEDSINDPTSNTNNFDVSYNIANTIKALYRKNCRVVTNSLLGMKRDGKSNQASSNEIDCHFSYKIMILMNKVIKYHEKAVFNI